MNYLFIIFSLIVLLNESTSQIYTTTVGPNNELPLVWTSKCDGQVCSGSWERGVPVCQNGNLNIYYDIINKFKKI
jgi:hypothetical protein